MTDLDRRIDPQRLPAIRTSLARRHRSQIGVRRRMKILPRRQILQVIVLFVRTGDQIRAAFERLVDQQHRLVRILLPVVAHSIPTGPKYPAGDLNSALISASSIGRVAAAHRGVQLGFVQLMIAAHQHHDRRVDFVLPVLSSFSSAISASVLILFFGDTPRNFATSSIVFCPGVCTSSGLPSPSGARSATASSFEVAFSMFAA